MTPADRLSHARLERRIQELERELRNVPARFSSSPQSTYFVVISGGNTLATAGVTTFTGIKRVASTPTLPVAVPVAAATYADGIGYGYLLDSAWNSTPGLVWVAMQSIASGLTFVATGGVVACSQSSASVSGGGQATIYNIIRAA